jgi:hypothetical protein
LDVPNALNKVIKRRISELGLQRQFIADSLWIARTDLYNRLVGRVYWSFPELVSLSEVLRMPVYELVRLAVREAREDGKVHPAEGRGQR